MYYNELNKISKIHYNLLYLGVHFADALRADRSKNSSPKTHPNTPPTPVRISWKAIKRPGNPALSSFCNWLLAHLHPPSGTTYHELSLLNTSRSLPVGAHAHQPNVPSGLWNSG
ncbi:hypothetical protein WG66_016734 [Moniliophthora roreri]|nr:hypothetical protein WG66_016734 [Moniliophthora roreri]